VLDGEWISGIIDRLHLHRDESGRVTRVEVIDFKTDAVNDICILSERYSGQMNAYRRVIEKAYPNAKVECILLSTRCRGWVAV
jgi:ATP-dependent exoDNAse (exonuclease V) beta subunit